MPEKQVLSFFSSSVPLWLSLSLPPLFKNITRLALNSVPLPLPTEYCPPIKKYIKHSLILQVELNACSSLLLLWCVLSEYISK